MTSNLSSSPRLTRTPGLIKNSTKIIPYIFVLPFVLSFLIFFLYPIISTVIMSFQKILGPGDVEFIGFSNYSRLFSPRFYNTLKVTTLYTVYTIAVLVPIPIILAAILNSKVTIFKEFFRSAFFIPALTSVVVAGIFFRYSFGDQPTSLINTIVGVFGGEPVKWLMDRSMGMLVLIIYCTWRWLGVNIVYFLSGLQSIPDQLYESADIDGANALQKFFSITIPSLKPVIIYVITISVYGGYSMFAESYTLWAGPRSPGDIGTTIVNFIYQQGFNQNDLGYGSAIGIALLGIVMIINVIQLTLFGFFKKESD